jgi:hypothetical protein
VVAIAIEELERGRDLLEGEAATRFSLLLRMPGMRDSLVSIAQRRVRG